VRLGHHSSCVEGVRGIQHHLNILHGLQALELVHNLRLNTSQLVFQVGLEESSKELFSISSRLDLLVSHGSNCFGSLLVLGLKSVLYEDCEENDLVFLDHRQVHDGLEGLLSLSNLREHTQELLLEFVEGASVGLEKFISIGFFGSNLVFPRLALQNLRDDLLVINFLLFLGLDDRLINLDRLLRLSSFSTFSCFGLILSLSFFGLDLGSDSLLVSSSEFFSTLLVLLIGDATILRNSLLTLFLNTPMLDAFLQSWHRITVQ